MSYCRKEGKDQIIFVTEEDHEAPIVRDDYSDDQEGLIREDGTINWECPCLGGMASGPCGVEFRESFTCFHYSTEEFKGSECVEQFRDLQGCMTKYPEYYTRRSSEPEEEGDDDDDAGSGEKEDGEGQNIEQQSSEGTEDGIGSDQNDSSTDKDEGTAL